MQSKCPAYFDWLGDLMSVKDNVVWNPSKGERDYTFIHTLLTYVSSCEKKSG